DREGFLDFNVRLATAKTQRSRVYGVVLRPVIRLKRRWHGSCAHTAASSRTDRANGADLVDRATELSTPFFNYTHDCFDDVDVAGAAAKIPTELEPHTLGGGIRNPLHDVARGNQHTGRTETALQTVLLRKCFP